MNIEIEGTAGPEQSGLTKDERTWGMLAHLLGLFGFLGPLIVYLVKKDESKFVHGEAREALNFQISLILYWIGCFVLTIIVVGFLLMMALGVWALVMIILAAIKANEGKPYRYPLTIRLIK